MFEERLVEIVPNLAAPDQGRLEQFLKLSHEAHCALELGLRRVLHQRQHLRDGYCASYEQLPHFHVLVVLLAPFQLRE